MEVQRGEVVGLLGPNGCGKSTLLRVFGTLLKPNAGNAFVNGIDVVANPDGVRSNVGYLAHSAGLYEDLTALENLTFAAQMLGLPLMAAETVLDRVGLGYVASERVRGFSAGMQRRLALARLLLMNPKVLLLDEPYSNLDVQGIALMNSVVGEIIEGGGSALVVLHELAPAVAILDRTVTMAFGRIDMTLSEQVIGEPSPALVAVN